MYRAPFVNLGLNRCGAFASSPGTHSGWCSPTSGVEASTSFDTSAMYMASGHLLSPSGESVYMYSSGQPFTHGGDSANQTWKNNTGIRILSLRRDGFVSIDAPYDFSGGHQNGLYPSFTTVELTVPPLPCATGENVAISANMVTSVAGFVAIGFEQAGKELDGFGLSDANRLKGNSLSAVATWGTRGGSVNSLAGKQVSVRVAMADASLYSLNFVCA